MPDDEAIGVIGPDGWPAAGTAVGVYRCRPRRAGPRAPGPPPAVSVSEGEPPGGRAAAAALVRPGDVALLHPPIERVLQLGHGREHPPTAVKNSARIVLCSRSTFPVGGQALSLFRDLADRFH